MTGQADTPSQALRAFLAAPVSCEDAPEASTVGELLTAVLLGEWQAASPFAGPKTAVYLAAVRAGLLPGLVAGDRIGELDITRAEALAEAAIRYMGKPSADRTATALRAMITAKQLAVADAGNSRGLAPDWHKPTFTATEILAAIGDVPGGEHDG